MTSPVLCVDVGSTFTKAALVDLDDGVLMATAACPTTLDGDILDGVSSARAAVEARAGVGASDLLACSSAGGGLRIAVVGYERLVTAEAGTRVALTAGGRVVHLHAGCLDSAGTAALRAAAPDVILLVGGTDGGNDEVILHNATRLASSRPWTPVVYAGNAAAAETARELFSRRRRQLIVADNVLPRIGALEPASARSAIREVFLRHVIGGKGLSRGPAFARMVRAATPDVVLSGVEILADGCQEVAGVGDVIVVDIGGATTDVYSVITPDRDRPPAPADVVATLWRARTVEGDLGMRWNAPGVIAAGRAEHLLDGPLPAGAAAEDLHRYAQRAAADPGMLPSDELQRRHDTSLAELAVTVAVRRHGRPGTVAGSPRPLRDVGLVVGSGGVLRHGSVAARRQVLDAVITDYPGGWTVPEHARLAVDERYVLFAAGLLAADAPLTAARLVSRGLVMLER